MTATPFERQLFDRLDPPPPPCPRCGRKFDRETTTFIAGRDGFRVPCPTPRCFGGHTLRTSWELLR